MKVRQYAYLSVKSDVLDPDAITQLLGSEPDDAKAKGAKRSHPRPVPRCHLWAVHSGYSRTSSLTDHFDGLFSKISGHVEILKGLAARDDTCVIWQVVRNFDPGPEDAAVLGDSLRDEDMPKHVGAPGQLEIPLDLPSEPALYTLRGQHPLVGFDIDSKILTFLANAGITMNFDEYADEYE